MIRPPTRLWFHPLPVPILTLGFRILPTRPALFLRGPDSQFPFFCGLISVRARDENCSSLMELVSLACVLKDTRLRDQEAHRRVLRAPVTWLRPLILFPWPQSPPLSNGMSELSELSLRCLPPLSALGRALRTWWSSPVLSPWS